MLKKRKAVLILFGLSLLSCIIFGLGFGNTGVEVLCFLIAFVCSFAAVIVWVRQIRKEELVYKDLVIDDLIGQTLEGISAKLGKPKQQISGDTYMWKRVASYTRIEIRAKFINGVCAEARKYENGTCVDAA